MLESSDIAVVVLVVVLVLVLVLVLVASEVDTVVSLVSPSSPAQPLTAIPAARERARRCDEGSGVFA